MEQIDLLLLGKSENGRSLAGTAIMKRHAFEVDVDYEVAEYKDKKIKVVDCSGFGDNCLDTEDEVNTFASWITKAMEINSSDGYSAFVIVLKYGNQSMKEEVDACEALRRIFGHDILRNYGILLMTNGDSYDRDCQRTGLAFENWCRQQDGRLSELLEECDGRIVLFDNFTEDIAKKDAQIDRLLELIASLPAGGKRYTDELFQMAADERDRSLAEAKNPVLSGMFMDEISYVLLRFEELQELQDQERTEPGAQVAEWAELCDRTESLVKHMQTESAQTKMEKFVFKFADSLQQFVDVDGSQRKEKKKKWEKLYERAEKLDKAYMDAKIARVCLICDGVVFEEGSVMDSIASLIMDSSESAEEEEEKGAHSKAKRKRNVRKRRNKKVAEKSDEEEEEEDEEEEDEEEDD